MIAQLTATLVGLVMTRCIIDGHNRLAMAIGQPRVEGFARWSMGTVPLFGYWTLALLALRVGLHPRRRMRREPGIVGVWSSVYRGIRSTGGSRCRASQSKAGLWLLRR